jgi:hypothetical protein
MTDTINQLQTAFPSFHWQQRSNYIFGTDYPIAISVGEHGRTWRSVAFVCYGDDRIDVGQSAASDPVQSAELAVALARAYVAMCSGALDRAKAAPDTAPQPTPRATMSGE